MDSASQNGGAASNSSDFVGDPRLADSGLTLGLTSLKVTVTSRNPARRGVGTFVFFRIDLVGDTELARWRFGVRFKLRVPGSCSASLLP